MQWIKYSLVGVLSFFVVSCSDYTQLKANLQKEYDRMNESGNRAFCYYVGNLQFPYIETTATNDDKSRSARLNRERLPIRLPLFTELGLLSREQISDNPILYRYQLTEEGRKYQYTYDRSYWDSSRIKYENYFCFGRRILLKITDVNDYTHQRNNGKYVETIVDYDYHIENLPEWAKSEKLYQVYKQLPGLFSDDDVFPGSAKMKKENGNYYNDGGISWTNFGVY